MRRTLAILGVGALVLVGVYFAGLLPERSERMAADARVTAVQAERDAAAARVQAGRLLGDLLWIEEVLAARNYGQAQQLTSSFFDGVRDDMGRANDPGLRAALDDIQGRRDVVIAALARTDPESAALLKAIEVRLRRALGYPVPENDLAGGAAAITGGSSGAATGTSNGSGAGAPR